jgi:hypothetical protein
LNLTCILWCYIYIPKIVSIFEAFLELTSGKHFSIVSNSDRDPKPTGPKVELDLILLCYIYVPEKDHVCEVFHELSSWNHISIVSNSDLDIEPTSHKVELNLYLVTLHLCTNFF